MISTEINKLCATILLIVSTSAFAFDKEEMNDIFHENEPCLVDEKDEYFSLRKAGLEKNYHFSFLVKEKLVEKALPLLQNGFKQDQSVEYDTEWVLCSLAEEDLVKEALELKDGGFTHKTAILRIARLSKERGSSLIEKAIILKTKRPEKRDIDIFFQLDNPCSACRF